MSNRVTDTYNYQRSLNNTYGKQSELWGNTTQPRGGESSEHKIHKANYGKTQDTQGKAQDNQGRPLEYQIHKLRKTQDNQGRPLERQTYKLNYWKAKTTQTVRTSNT